MAECLVALACVQLLAIDVWMAAAPGPVDRLWGVLGAVAGWVLVVAFLLAIPGLVATAVDVGGGSPSLAVLPVGVLSVAALCGSGRGGQSPTGPACWVTGVRSSVESGRSLVVAAVVVPLILDLPDPGGWTVQTAWLGALSAIGLLALPVAELMDALPSPWPSPSAGGGGWRGSQVAAVGALSASLLGLVACVSG